MQFFKMTILIITFGVFLYVSRGFILHQGSMPTLSKEARLAPPKDATSVTFKMGSWGCPKGLLSHQIEDGKRYRAVFGIGRLNDNGTMKYCWELKTDHSYDLTYPQVRAYNKRIAEQNRNNPDKIHRPKIAWESACPDNSCVAFDATVRIDGETREVVLFAPNSFISDAK